MPSLNARIFDFFLRRMPNPMSGKDEPIRTRERIDALASWAPRPPGIKGEALTVAGRRAEWLIPRNARMDCALLYLHGGAYYMCGIETHRLLAAELARAAHARALILDYRLAPEHPFPAALDDAVAAYTWLLAQGYPPHKIAIAGDSAGGGLAAATLVALRERGLPLPACAALLSPWTDLAGTGDSRLTRANLDPIFRPGKTGNIAQYYIGQDDARNPLISPLYADLHGLPPIFIHAGDHEIILNDSTRLAERLRAAGVDVQIKVWDFMWHVFQSTSMLIPESRKSISELGAFIQANLAK